MPDVKIKGYSGAEFEYKDVPKVWLAAPESTEDNPVLVPFTYGEAVDSVEVVPDFSAGDQTVTVPEGYLARSAVIRKPESLIPGNIKAGETVAGIAGEYEGVVLETEEATVPADFSAGDMVLEPSEGKYLTKATVQKPGTLIPENIAEGVNVAGIIGALTASGGAVCKSGTFTGNGGALTFTHGLGVLPDVFIASITSSISPTVTRDSGLMYVGVSTAIKNLSGAAYAQFASRTYGSTSARMEKEPTGIDNIQNTRIFRAFTETTVNLGSDYCQTASGVTYTWIAIGGLT